MLPELAKLTQDVNFIKSDVRKYCISEISNFYILNQIRKAFEGASSLLTTESSLNEAKLKFYASLQEMCRLGIDLNNTKLWFINQYGANITAQYQYQAILDAIARRGYICIPTFEYILSGEEFSTERNLENRTIIRYKDQGLPKDINISNLDDYKLFFLLLEIKHNHKFFAEQKAILTPEEIKKRKACSKTKDSGQKIRKDGQWIVKEDSSIWETWTKQMINKTLILSALSYIKNAIPEIQPFYDLEERNYENIESKEEEKAVFTNLPELTTLQKESYDIENITPELEDRVRYWREAFKKDEDLASREKARIRSRYSSLPINERHILLKEEAPIILALGEDFKNALKNAIFTISNTSK